MKLHLTSAYETHESLDRLTKLASLDRVGTHTICASPREADAILFVEDAHFNDYLYRRVLKHPLVNQYKTKTFIYTEADKPYHVLPGLYCNMPSNRFRKDVHQAFPFVRSMNQYVKHISQWDIEQDWAFSFVGSMSHRLRRSILKFSHLSPGVRDTSEFDFWHATEQEKASQGMVFAESMSRSRFILCPRGIGTASFRPFEAMQAGRAPVIISDQWVPPPQVNWDFAVFVPEAEINGIPDLLESIRDEAFERGRAARAAWESTYAPDVMFNTTATSVNELLANKISTQQTDREQTDVFEFGRWITELQMSVRDMTKAYRQI